MRGPIPSHPRFKVKTKYAQAGQLSCVHYAKHRTTTTLLKVCIPSSHHLESKAPWLLCRRIIRGFNLALARNAPRQVWNNLNSWPAFSSFFSFLRSEKRLPKAWGHGTNCLSWYLFLLFLSHSKFWEVEAFAECRYGQVLCTIFWVCLYIENVIFCCFFFFHFCIYASVVYSYFCARNATWLCFRGPSTRARPEFLNWDIWNKLCLSSQIMISFFFLPFYCLVFLCVWSLLIVAW